MATLSRRGGEHRHDKIADRHRGYVTHQRHPRRSGSSEPCGDGAPCSAVNSTAGNEILDGEGDLNLHHRGRRDELVLAEPDARPAMDRCGVRRTGEPELPTQRHGRSRPQDMNLPSTNSERDQHPFADSPS